MKALFDMETFKFLPGDTVLKKIDGWQFAPLRMIMEIKRDLRRKSRLVIGGHVTDASGYDCYAATIRTENVRLIVYMVVRVPLSVLVINIGNAYLNALCAEKIYTRCGPEFGEKEGMIAVIHKAIYGLKSSANAFYHLLGTKLDMIDFKPSRIDGAFWYRLRKDGSGYDYIASHVDDLMIAAENVEEIVEFLKEEFIIKDEDLPNDYLGLT